jgi:hypothetical protein
MNQNDILWKGLLEDIFDDFLRFFFPQADKIFDFKKGFQFLDKELEQLFPAEDLQSPKYVDKLVKVFTKDGKEEWMLVHIEIQGYADKDFAKRMFTYFYRILDKYNKPVTAIVLYTDAGKNFHPVAYEYNNLGTSIIFRFNTYKIIEQDENDLQKSNNLFAIAIRTALLALKKNELNDSNLYLLKFSLVKNLLQQHIGRRKIDGLFSFIQHYVNFDDPQLNTKFDNDTDTLKGKTKTMGIKELIIDLAKKEGIKQGREEGIEQGFKQGDEQGFERGIKQGDEQGFERSKVETIKNLLAANQFTDAQIANFANVPESLIGEIRAGLNKK